MGVTDPYRICRDCRKFGTMDCPNSSLCLDLDSKPYFELEGEPIMDENKKQTVMAFVRLACMLIATGCTMFGVAMDADALFTGVMLVISVVVYIWAWYKNNNVTKAATEAQKVLDEMKKGVEVTATENNAIAGE